MRAPSWKRPSDPPVLSSLIKHLLPVVLATQVELVHPFLAPFLAPGLFALVVVKLYRRLPCSNEIDVPAPEARQRKEYGQRYYEREHNSRLSGTSSRQVIKVGGHAHEHRIRAPEPQPEHEVEEVTIVVVPDTIRHPWTVMVHSRHTFVADVTVMCQHRLRFAAFFAPASVALGDLGVDQIVRAQNGRRLSRVAKYTVEIVEKYVEYHYRGTYGVDDSFDGIERIAQREDDRVEHEDHNAYEGRREDHIQRSSHTQSDIDHGLTAEEEPVPGPRERNHLERRGPKVPRSSCAGEFPEMALWHLMPSLSGRERLL